MKTFKNFLFVILVTILFSQYGSARGSIIRVFQLYLCSSLIYLFLKKLKFRFVVECELW